MSWLSKSAKSVEKSVSNTATKLGVGNDLKKAANIYGAASVGGVIGGATGFLAGGLPGAVYGGTTGFVVAGYGKYKGDSSSKYISNAAGDALIAGTVGPLIFKPGAASLITAPGPVSSYGSTTLVHTASGGLLGSTGGISSVFGSVGNVFTDALNYIGKGGLTQIAVDGLRKVFGGKQDPTLTPNPDYQQGNAVPPGGGFPSWLSNVLPGKSYDPTAPGSNGTAGGGGANPVTNVSVAPGSVQGGSSGDGGSIFSLKPILIAAAVTVGAFFLVKKGGLKLA